MNGNGPMKVGIAGAGVIGLATAYHLHKLGAEPFIVESKTVGSGSSAGNAGWVCPSISGPLPAPGLTLQSLLWMMKPDSPLYIKPSAALKLRPWLTRFRAHCTQADFDHGIAALASLNSVTMERYDEMAADGVDFEIGRQGLLHVFRDPAKAAATRAELDAIAAHGVTTYTVVEKDEIYHREPMLRGGFTEALYVEADRHVRPESVTAGLCQVLRARGVPVLENTAVTGFEADGNTVRAMVTTAGSMDVDAVVLAAGAETGRLTLRAGMQIPLTAGKGYSVTIDRPVNQLRQPLYLGEAKIGLSPFDGALRFAGTMELSGINLTMDAKRIGALRRRVSRDVDIPEALDGGVDWVGMRPLVPDTLPVMGRLPTRDNVYVNTGHQMLGVTLAPSSGWALSQLILNGASDVDLAPFSPSRF